jgi:hypothetical protein
MAIAGIKRKHQNSGLSEQAREARAAYFREWKSKNKDKVREYNRRFWERKAGKNKNGGDL